MTAQTMVYLSTSRTLPASGGLQYDTIASSCPQISYSTSGATFGTWTANSYGRYIIKAYSSLPISSTVNYEMGLYVNGTEVVQQGFNGKNTSTYYNGNTISTWVFGSQVLNPGTTFYPNLNGASLLVNGSPSQFSTFATCTYVPLNISGGCINTWPAYTTSITALTVPISSSAPIPWPAGAAVPYLSYNASTYQFTALVTGLYEIMANVTLTGFTSNIGCSIILFVNGTQTHQSSFWNYGAALSGYMTFPINKPIRLIAGQTFYVGFAPGSPVTISGLQGYSYFHCLCTQEG